jgi:hypothetical protein
MARHRFDGARATGAAGGVPAPRYAAGRNENGRFEDDDGTRLVKQAPRPGQAATTARLISRRTHKHRYGMRPWQVLVPLVGLGSVLHLIPPVRSLWWIALVAGAIYAGAVQVPKRKNGPTGHLYYAFACTVAGAVWLAVVIAYGMFDGVGRLAVVTIAIPGLFPLSWWWWGYHRIRPTAYREEEAPAAPNIDPVLVAWAEHVEAPKKLLPGARLIPRERTKGSRAYMIFGVRSRDTTRKLTGEEFRHSLAGALGIDPDEVSLERPAKGPERNGVNARLLIIEADNEQLASDVHWPGPTLDRVTGTWAPGVYADTPARCRLYQSHHGLPTRALNNAISGLMGKGKSRFVELSVAEMLASEIYVVWYGDGQEGASAPALRDYVDWYATRREEVVTMLKAAWKIAKARQRHDLTVAWTDTHGHQRTGRGFWPATPEEPFLQVLLDECQELLSDARVAKLVKALQRLGPKVGVGITLVTQEWLMHETGGASGDPGAQTIRSFAQTGLVALFKTGSDINNNALGGSLAGINPRTLPDEPGWCYLIGQGTRPIPVRLYHIEPDDLYDRLARIANKASLEALAVIAAGQDYAERWQRLNAIPSADAEGGLDDIEAELDLLLNGPQAGGESTRGALVGIPVKQAVLEVVRKQGPIKRADVDAALVDGGRTASKSAIDQALASWARTGHLISTQGVWDVPDRQDQADGDAERGAPQLELSTHQDA